jgi:hypothetical protein
VIREGTGAPCWVTNGVTSRESRLPTAGIVIHVTVAFVLDGWQEMGLRTLGQLDPDPPAPAMNAGDDPSRDERVWSLSHIEVGIVLVIHRVK